MPLTVYTFTWKEGHEAKLVKFYIMFTQTKILLALIMTFCQQTNALLKCSNSSLVITSQLCINSTFYEIDPDSKEGEPNILVQKLSGIELSGIDEEKNIIILDFTLQFEWNDTRLFIKRPPQNSEIWHRLSEEEGMSIYFPKVSFKNARKTPGGNHFGPPRPWDYYWYAKPHHLEYRQKVNLALSCSFELSSYPFDSQQCDIIFGSSENSIAVLKYLPTIIMNDNLVTTFGMEPLKIDKKSLPFDITIEGIEPFTINVYGWNLSHAGARLHLKRNTIGMLIGGFYIPTVILATLSLLSFMIDPEVVPGRLGLLITLTLITMNVYNSVQAPSTRNFSYIEVWIIGIQAPIFIAILEYGIILGIRKMKKGLDEDQDARRSTAWMIQAGKSNWFERKLDFWTFFGLLVYIIMFNIFYWWL